MLTFGPVPSRRLGRSLGINNIPPKSCSYSCVYCQVGPTRHTEIEPRSFYSPQEILDAVREHVARVREHGEPIDYLTFVPDGEPTLDAQLGASICALRQLEIPIAVICNGSLLWRPEVREQLSRADWVSLKVDVSADPLWRRINRPHAALNHQTVLQGLLDFAREYQGTLVSESMLVRGLNDGSAAACELATFLERLNPEVAYLAVPTRPPSEPRVRAPDEAAVNRFFQIVSQRVPRVELLVGYEGNAFASTGDPVQDLLDITAVHPLREEAVRQLLARRGADWQVLEGLIDQGRLVSTEYQGRRFLVRRFGRGEKAGGR